MNLHVFTDLGFVARIMVFTYLKMIMVAMLICSAQGGNVKTKGTVYLSNIRMVFVANKPIGNFFAFDLPLVCVACLGLDAFFLGVQK